MSRKHPATVCPTCGRTGKPWDRHHPLGLAHAPGLTIDECFFCHSVLTERQRDGGVQLDHEGEYGEVETVWALIRGLADISALLAYNAPSLGESNAERSESLGVAAGRLLDMLHRSGGEVGIQGPDPRANDLRRAGRRGHRVTDISRPYRRTPPPDPSTDEARARALLGLLAAALDYLPDGARMPEIRARIESLVGRAGELAHRFHWLESRDRAPEFIDALGLGGRLIDALTGALKAIGSPDQLINLVNAGRQVKALWEPSIAFAEQLLATEDADQAEAVLDAYLVELAAT